MAGIRNIRKTLYMYETPALPDLLNLKFILCLNIYVLYKSFSVVF